MSNAENDILDAIIYIGYGLAIVGVIALVIAIVNLKRATLDGRWFAGALLLGIIVGIVGISSSYALSVKTVVCGIPFPEAIFLDEGGNTVDYISNNIVLVMMGNLLSALGVFMGILTVCYYLAGLGRRVIKHKDNDERAINR